MSESERTTWVSWVRGDYPIKAESRAAVETALRLMREGVRARGRLLDAMGEHGITRNWASELLRELRRAGLSSGRKVWQHYFDDLTEEGEHWEPPWKTAAMTAAMTDHLIGGI